MGAYYGTAGNRIYWHQGSCSLLSSWLSNEEGGDNEKGFDHTLVLEIVEMESEVEAYYKQGQL